MAEAEDTVSVIIPTYNRANLLKTAIESVLVQSHPPLEVLICDDGSTDETSDVVMAHPDPRVRWVGAENHAGWPSVPRNRGLQAAKGTWLAFLDDDDTWLLDKLARQIKALRKSGCRASSTEAWRYMPGRSDPMLLANKESCRLGFETILPCNYVVCSSAVIRRDLIDKVGLFPEGMLCEDYALWLRVCCFTDFIFLGEPLVAYRDAPNLSVRRNSKPEAEQQIAVLNNFKVWMTSATPPNASTFLPLINNRINWWQEHLVAP